MADVSMCQNYACPVRSSCYRYVAEPSPWQSFAEFIWDGKCEYYIPLWSDQDTTEIDKRYTRK